MGARMLVAVCLLAAGGTSLPAEETLLGRLDLEFQAAAAKARPGVVQVIADRPGRLDFTGGPRAKGSGVVWNADGIVVTAFESVGRARKATLVDAAGRRVPAEVVGRDSAVGIAVLRARAEGAPLAACPRGDSRRVRPGAILFVVGNPHDLPGSVSFGIAGGVDRTIRVGPSVQRGLLQTTAPINPGDAGGALVDAKGEMVGMVLSSFNRSPSAFGVRRFMSDRDPVKSRPSLSGEAGFDGEFFLELEGEAPVGSEGIGFAIPVHRLGPWVEEILANGRVRRSWFGLSLREPTEAERAQLALPEGRGLVVTEVIPDGPSAKAGIRLHDIMLSAGAGAVDSLDDLYAIREESLPGTRVPVSVRRKGRDERIEVVLEEAPRPAMPDGEGEEGR